MLIGTGIPLLIKGIGASTKLPLRIRTRLRIGLTGLSGILTAAGMNAACGSFGFAATLGCAVAVMLLPPPSHHFV